MGGQREGGGGMAYLAMLVSVVELWGKECDYVVRERVEVVLMQRWLNLELSNYYLRAVLALQGSMTNRCQDFVTIPSSIYTLVKFKPLSPVILNTVKMFLLAFIAFCTKE